MKSVLMYDLEDNYICEFKNYKECANYFLTTTKVIACYICRSRKGIIDKKYDKTYKRWVRLFKEEKEIEESEE